MQDNVVTTIGATFIQIHVYQDCEGKCFWRGPTKKHHNHVWQEIPEALYDELLSFEVDRIKAARPIIPDSACCFGKCDGQNACQKVGQCRYKHHTEGGSKGQLDYSNKETSK
jgi:hypothetical protein